MCLAQSICNMKFPEGVDLGLPGNAAARQILCGHSILTVWLEVYWLILFLLVGTSGGT